MGVIVSLVELSEQTCRDLLLQEGVGRVCFCTPLGPRVLPVTFTVHDNSVFFRTTPYSALGTYGRDTAVAMEVDSLDKERREGWSVVVVGRTEVVDDPDEVAAIRNGWDPTPWPDGNRHLYIRLHVHEISGRRVVATVTPADESPAVTGRARRTPGTP